MKELESYCSLCAMAGHQTKATKQHATWLALCDGCYEDVIESERTGVPIRGCDVHGEPLDPNHPWNKE